MQGLAPRHPPSKKNAIRIFKNKKIVIEFSGFVQFPLRREWLEAKVFKLDPCGALQFEFAEFKLEVRGSNFKMDGRTPDRAIVAQTDRQTDA